MSVEGLDSFITKFKDLWRTGSHAKLTVTTHAGKAWVNLNVGLGRFPTRPHGGLEQGVPQQIGNAKQRRRERCDHEKVSEAEQVEEATTAKNNSDGTEKNKAEEASMNTNESDAMEKDNSDFVKIACEVNDEFCKEDEENVVEEMVIIFGEYNHQKPFDDKTYIWRN
jgi:hypothetical protein